MYKQNPKKKRTVLIAKSVKVEPAAAKEALRTLTTLGGIKLYFHFYFLPPNTVTDMPLSKAEYLLQLNQSTLQQGMADLWNCGYLVQFTENHYIFYHTLKHKDRDIYEEQAIENNY